MQDSPSNASTLSLGDVVLFVPDVPAALAFYEQAFGLMPKLATPAFGQLDTGGVTLAFGAEFNEEAELPDGFAYNRNRPDTPAAGVQISFVAPDVDTAFARAVEAGATPVVEPQRMPWGQTVSRVRDLNGVLVSIVSPQALS